MHRIAITRFDNVTYKENRDWCKRYNFQGCIYGTPIKLSESILPDTILFVLEMNNTTNKIMGIGMIKFGANGCSVSSKKHKIYSDNNYNRFVYRSDYRIDFNENYCPLRFHKKIQKLEQCLFKGSRHCKRGQGIQLLPIWIRNIPKLNICDDIRRILNMGI